MVFSCRELGSKSGVLLLRNSALCTIAVLLSLNSPIDGLEHSLLSMAPLTVSLVRLPGCKSNLVPVCVAGQGIGTIDHDPWSTNSSHPPHSLASGSSSLSSLMESSLEVWEFYYLKW